MKTSETRMRMTRDVRLRAVRTLHMMQRGLDLLHTLASRVTKLLRGECLLFNLHQGTTMW